MAQRLLFVEDEGAQRALFIDAIGDWNVANPDRRFEPEVSETYNEAIQLLKRSRFDCALVDLRLPGGEGKTPGQDLAGVCVGEYGIPAGIISGHPSDFDNSKFGGMIKVFDKGDSNAYESAVDWFSSLAPMMMVLEGTRKKMLQMGASVFAERVWPRWKTYEALKGIDREQLIGIVSRQYASHIAEILGTDSEENVKWHPFENYIIPALFDGRPHTGDLFRLEGDLWVVLSPQCDMATGKAASVLLARCEQKPTKLEWEKHVAFSQPGTSSSKKEDADKFFRKLVNQFEPAQHFLPPLDEGNPLTVEFKKLRTVPLPELQQRLSDRVASIASPFLGNLTQRFGAYISRMGQPNIDTSHFS